MYRHFFKEDYQDVFEDGRYPVISRFSNSHNIPKWSYNYHAHKDDAEIVFIDKGQAVYTIETESYTVSEGEVLVVEKGNMHSLEVPDSPGSAWVCNVHSFKLHGLEPGKILARNTHPLKAAGEQLEFFKHASACLDHLRKFNDPVFRFSCNVMAAAVVTVTSELFRGSGQKISRENLSFAKDIMLYLDEHYEQPITLKMLADRFHVSQSHISHEFAKVYKISPINFIIERRIDEARWMLINTGQSMTEIARKLGYDNTTHFSALFKRRLKIAPQDYRRQYQKDPAEPEE